MHNSTPGLPRPESRADTGRMPKRLLPLLTIGLVVAHARAALATAADDFRLPDMQVAGELSLQDFAFPRKSDVKEPGFPERSPFIDVQFPGRAAFDGVATGTASVGVLLDQNGRPLDFLLIRYTRDYFGQALLEEAKRSEFTPKQIRGTAVPGPFTITYNFEPPAGLTHISGFEAASRRAEVVQGGPGLAYEPQIETALDGGQLEPVQIRIPVLPPQLARPDKRPVRVLVSFYVDEAGRVRLPGAESDLEPELVAYALHAVQQWAFKPPTIKGRPVLVRTMRAVTFREMPPAAKAK